MYHETTKHVMRMLWQGKQSMFADALAYADTTRQASKAEQARSLLDLPASQAQTVQGKLINARALLGL